MHTVWTITAPNMDNIQDMLNNANMNWQTEKWMAEQKDGDDHDNTPLAREAQGKISLYL